MDMVNIMADVTALIPVFIGNCVTVLYMPAHNAFIIWIEKITVDFFSQKIDPGCTQAGSETTYRSIEFFALRNTHTHSHC